MGGWVGRWVGGWGRKTYHAVGQVVDALFGDVVRESFQF